MELTSWIFPGLRVAFATLVVFSTSSADEYHAFVGDTVTARAQVAGPDLGYELEVEWTWPEEYLDGPGEQPYTTDGAIDLVAVASTRGEPITVTAETVRLWRVYDDDERESVEVENIVNPNMVTLTPEPRTIEIEFEIRGRATIGIQD